MCEAIRKLEQAIFIMNMPILHHHRHGTRDARPVHNGASAGYAIHDHDIRDELGRRLDAVWRYDRFIVRAKGRPSLQAFWEDLKTLEMRCVDDLEELLQGRAQRARL